MSIIKEFKEFAVRGNVIDMAVGIIIGAAFGKITSTLVNEVIMPPIGLALGNVDFTELSITLRDAVPADEAAGVEALPAVAINYGLFVNTVIDFVIVAFCVFLLIKFINRLKRKEEAPAPAPVTTKPCPRCCSAIPLEASRCPQCTSDL